MSLTADTITDLQICELRARAHGLHHTCRNDSLIDLCDIARSVRATGRDPDGTIITRELARARCAKILNAALKSEATRRGVTLGAIVAEFVDAAEKEQS